MSTMRADPSQGAAHRGFLAANACKAITLHFANPGFDAFKYNFKAGIKPAQYERRRDRYFFEKVGTKHRNEWALRHFFMANVLAGVTFVGNMDEEHYIQWQAHIQSMTYRFEQEIKMLKRVTKEYECSFNELFAPTATNPMSLLIEKFLSDDLSCETLVALNNLVGFLKRLRKQIGSDPLGVFEEIAHRVEKYDPFIRPLVKLDKLRAVVIKTFT